MFDLIAKYVERLVGTFGVQRSGGGGDVQP
jgi:hypothetical protein